MKTFPSSQGLVKWKNGPSHNLKESKIKNNLQRITQSAAFQRRPVTDFSE